MRILLYLIILIFASCDKSNTNQNQIEIFTKDYRELKSKNILEVINIETIKNFSSLRKMMGNITCNGKASGLKFESNDTLYHTTGFSECPTSQEIGCYFRRNIITIKNDSIVIKDEEKTKVGINHLTEVLNTIIDNPNNFQSNKNQIKPALIYLYIDDKYSIETTKTVLKEIVTQFQSINKFKGTDYFNFDILFQSYDISSLPPLPKPPKPPPEPSEIELIE